MNGSQFQELRSVLEADLQAYGRTEWGFRERTSAQFIDRIIEWQRRWRWLEYARVNPSALDRILLAGVWRMHVRASTVLGFTIPVGVFGAGLQIAHVGTIVVNENVRVGSRCRIHPSTSLGANDRGAPTLGNDCYVGPGARVIGDVHLGDNVTIGANSVVTHSFEEDNIVLVGSPARVLKRDEPRRWRH